MNLYRVSVKLLFPLAFALFSATVLAQRYPERSIRIVVPFTPGGGTDNLTRVMAPKLSEILGQQIVVDNRPGGAAQIGPALVAKAAADGYTLLTADQSFSTNPGLYPNLPYDSIKDFSAISMLATGAVVLVVHPSVPAKSLKELLVLIRSRPGQISFATGGFGTGTHLAMELFKSAMNVELIHIPYKGAGASTSAVVGGEVVMMFNGPSSAVSFVKSGRLRAIAITGNKRNASLPEVATFNELRLGSVDAGTIWYSLAPANTPKPVIQLLSESMAKVLQMPDVRERLTALGYEAVGTSPEEAAAILKADIEKWAKVIREKNIRPE